MTALIVGAGPGMGRAIAAALGPGDGPVALIALMVNWHITSSILCTRFWKPRTAENISS